MLNVDTPSVTVRIGSMAEVGGQNQVSVTKYVDCCQFSATLILP